MTGEQSRLLKADDRVQWDKSGIKVSLIAARSAKLTGEASQ